MPAANPESGRKPPSRPKDAATLVLVRRAPNDFEVLMGQRHGGHVFLPDQWVFPGGRVDPADALVPAAGDLRADVTARLTRACTAGRARALALAAIRETFEETGLRLGRPASTDGRDVPAAWQEFFAGGLAPAVDTLDYIARAVTGTNRPRRFNARFFLADASAASGEPQASGEFVEVRWIRMQDARSMPLPNITTLILELVEGLVTQPPAADPARPVPVYRMLRGKRWIGAE